jgi:Fe-S-cluster containining protein
VATSKTSIYHGTPIHFKCLKCGHCCRTLINEDEDILIGLTLTPEEAKLFPQSKISPWLGAGRSEKEITRIMMYQLNTATCPHLENNICRIYDRRPIVCAQFPLTFSTDGYSQIASGEACLFIDDTEDTLKKKLDFNFSKSTFVDDGCWKALATEIGLLHNKIIEIEIEQLNIFIYNLKTLKWRASESCKTSSIR